MADKIVLRGGIRIYDTPDSGTGDPALTRDASTGDVGLASVLSGALTDGAILIGDVSNTATEAIISGDITLSNTGVASIGSGVIVDADINASAAIALSKLAALSNSIVPVTNGSGILTSSSVTATELGYVSGVTSAIQTQLGAKQATITGAATTITSSNLTVDRALISSALGKVVVSTVTNTELEYLSGTTSSVQNQLDDKLTVSIGSIAQGDLMYYDGGNWINFPRGTTGQTLQTNGTVLEWGTPTINGIPSGGSTDQYLRKLSGTDFDADWTTLTLADVTDVSATAGEVDILAGATLSTTELNYLDGVTSAIQTQLDSKLNNALAFNAVWVGSTSNLATQVGAGTNGQIFTIVGGTPQWVTPSATGTVSGPASSTDNAIARWNSTGGNTIQNSGVIIDDSNNITGVVGLSAATVVTSGTATLNDIIVSTTPSNDNALTQVLVRDSGTGVIKYRSAASITGGVSDGDKGDITVSSSGTVWTIDNDVVTYAKMQNVSATDRLLGRDTAGAGDTEELTVSGGIEFTGSGGIQTSALTGDVTKSAGGTSTTIANGAVTYAKIQSSSVGLTVVGRAGATSGVFAEIVGSADTVLRVNTAGTALAFGTIPSAAISDLAWSKITSTPTTIAGYGITDPIVYTSGSYANPAWITSLAWSKISSTPTTLSGYGITDSIYVRGGNTFGAASILGLTDAFNLTVQTGNASLLLRTNGTDRLTITNAGVATATGTWIFPDLRFRNVADTFTSLFSNTNTAARTYTTPDRSMTVAGTDDFVGLQDLYIPAAGMWPRVTSGCAPLSRTEVTTVNIQSLDFDQTSQEFAQFIFSMPRNWDNGTIKAKSILDSGKW
jgi:hypothetical protein